MIQHIEQFAPEQELVSLPHIIQTKIASSENNKTGQGPNSCQVYVSTRLNAHIRPWAGSAAIFIRWGGCRRQSRLSFRKNALCIPRTAQYDRGKGELTYRAAPCNP